MAIDYNNRMANIESAAELAELAAQSDHGTSSAYWSVTLANDIDMADYENWEGFTATSSTAWYMNFNGNGYTIYNLNGIYISGNWGFFQFLHGNVKNLTIEDIGVSATGAVCGICYSHYSGSEIENVKVRGYLSGSNVYGLSYVPSGTVTARKSSFSGSLIATSSFYGLMNGGITNNCYVTCIEGNQARGSANSFMVNGGRCNNCFFIGAVRYSGTSGNVRIASDNANYSYCVITNAAELLASGYTYSGTPSQNAGVVFFDNTDGDYFDSSYGATKAQLQDAAWLREKGFAI